MFYFDNTYLLLYEKPGFFILIYNLLIITIKSNILGFDILQKNLKNTPVLILGLTIVLLILLSFLPPKMKILGISIKPVDLFMDVKQDSLLNYSDPSVKSN